MQNIPRLIDANANRLLEALRVLEDTVRFLFDDKEVTGDFKALRHAVKGLKIDLEKKTGTLALYRDVDGDVGRDNQSSEMIRRDYRQIVAANMSRSKESLRVLEEYSKLYDERLADSFQRIRYKMYECEKRIETFIDRRTIRKEKGSVCEK